MNRLAVNVLAASALCALAVTLAMLLVQHRMGRGI